MEKNEQDKITAFDSLYTTNHIQMLKVVMPCFDHSIRQTLAVCIKYLELNYTLSFCSHAGELCGCTADKEDFSWNRLCSAVTPFCTGEEKQQLEQIAGLFRTMETCREMSQMMELMKEMSADSPDIFSSFAGVNSSFGCGSGSGSGSDSGSSGSGGCSGSDSTGPGAGSGGGMMDMLMGMLSPEQKTMFEMFGGNGSHESE